MTPVPLELPLDPPEACELANLIFEVAGGKALSDDIRNRIAARAALLKPVSLTPWMRSVERDPVHPSAYYVAVDGLAGGGATAPLLLHLAPASAPTSSIYPKPLLIGRMRRPNGAEMVINAIPFGAGDRQNVETYAARINPAFHPQPQGARATITVGQDFPAAFEAFRGMQKRTGKNYAALAGDYHAAVWAAIRAGWRAPYTVATELADAESVAELGGRGAFSRYSVGVPLTAAGLDSAGAVYQRIRHARAAAKISRGFDVEVVASEPVAMAGLRGLLEDSQRRGHLPQLLDAGPVAAAEMAGFARTARVLGITPSFRFREELAPVLHALVEACARRFNFRVSTAAEAEALAEELL